MGRASTPAAGLQAHTAPAHSHRKATTGSTAVVTSLVISLVQIGGIRGDIRELRSDMKLPTGKVYEMMAQK